LAAENETLIKAGKVNSGDGSMVSFYKEKLQFEMSENDRAFELLLNLSERTRKLSDLLRSVSAL
jgi:ACT domain-containing protein